MNPPLHGLLVKPADADQSMCFRNTAAAGYSGLYLTRQRAAVSGETAASSGGRDCGGTELRGNTVREEGAADKYKHWADRAQVPTQPGVGSRKR